MDAISNLPVRPTALMPLREADRIREDILPQSSGDPRPVRDEYVPEEKQESYGRYWLGKDEDGSPKIYFDDPEKAEDAPPEENGNKEAAPPGGGRKPEKCTANTDAVDREIKKLKEKKENLEKKIGQETDETKKQDLERQLSQVERELRQKDNDAYRRRRAVFTES